LTIAYFAGSATTIGATIVAGAACFFSVGFLIVGFLASCLVSYLTTEMIGSC
jgi:hypothetical protein